MAFAVTAAITGNYYLNADLNKHRNKPGVVYWHGDPAEKKIALTFDDGPNEPYTSQILDVLKENNVKATFFVVGKNAQKFPDSIRAEANAGHDIGNHSFSHPDMIFEFNKTVRKQLMETENIFKNILGQKPRLFRPPFGADDPFTFQTAEKLGYVVIKWSVSARDWERPGVPKIVANVLNHVQGGSIILMHDGNQCQGGDRSQTVDALKILIPELKKRGYEFVLIPALLNIDNE